MNFAPKPKRSQTAHEWVDYLRDSEGLGGILAKTEDIAKLKVSLKSALAVLDLENLAQKIELSWRSESKNELILLVSNASIASRLQQILPSLINELSKKGVLCSTIKVQLKPAPSAWEIKSEQGQKPSEKSRGFNPIARAAWQNLADQLAPDSELRKAVEKLLQNQAK